MYPGIVQASQEFKLNLKSNTALLSNKSSAAIRAYPGTVSAPRKSLSGERSPEQVNLHLIDGQIELTQSNSTVEQ